MDAIEKRALDLLEAECIVDAGEDGHAGAEAKIVHRAAVRAIIAALTPPDEPDQALLVSMAMLVYHGFGLLTPEQKQSQLREMRKLWDEVMGRGYYSPDNRERYVAMLPARPEVP
ncbi:hypothetical protein [Stenotrophomonas maltophilia]|uniref:hypothetical protein n=1 Tax=Stenotrophomonas maltophilia TaxID=40324 RepID=UPI002E79B010|nr:hypothetical protein [Stenotrophomonas maltophilia]